MQYTLLSETPKIDFGRALSTLFLGAGITFALFVVMDKLIQVEGEYVTPPELVPLEGIVLEKPVDNVPEKARIKPIPKPQELPKSMAKFDALPSGDTNNFSDYQPELPEPAVGKAELNVFSMGEGQATPVVRMEPKYPQKAAREGIEGWVKLIFSIDSAGQVKDIKVIDAEPARVFNKEAKRALSRWKYKPQLVNGKPTEQTDMQVVLNFRLDS